MLYNLRVVCEFSTPGRPHSPGVYERHSVHSEDGNILMHMAVTLHRYDPNFVSALLVSPDDRKIAWLMGNDHSAKWKNEEPQDFIS